VSLGRKDNRGHLDAGDRVSRVAETKSKREDRLAVAGVLLLIGYVVFVSVLHATSRPFWYDEFCTMAVATEPNAGAIWRALADAADTNPPFFYVVTKWFVGMVDDVHVGYRLPAVVGVASAIFGVFVFLRERLGGAAALVGASALLWTPLMEYSYEARPYGLLVGSVSLGMASWQRIERSRWYAVGVAAFLGIAVSFHYYAVLVWPAFILAEASVCIRSRRVRKDAIAALVAGGVPLLLTMNLAAALRQYYGTNFWSAPSFWQIITAHGWLFQANPFVGWIVALVATLTIGYLYFRGNQYAGEAAGFRVSRLVPPGEQLLSVSLLWLPVVAVAVAIVGNGGMTFRYMLPAVLGAAIIGGMFAGMLSYSVRIWVFLLVVAGYSWGERRVLSQFADGTLMARRTAAREFSDALVTRYSEGGLPIVISSGIDYLPISYYASAGTRRALHAVADPSRARRFAEGSDSVDLALLVLRRYLPIQVSDPETFFGSNKEFVVVSRKGGRFDWWPEALREMGYEFRLITDQGFRVERITSP
jgi:hypothetical protein